MTCHPLPLVQLGCVPSVGPGLLGCERGSPHRRTGGHEGGARGAQRGHEGAREGREGTVRGCGMAYTMPWDNMRYAVECCGVLWKPSE